MSDAAGRISRIIQIDAINAMCASVVRMEVGLRRDRKVVRQNMGSAQDPVD